MVQFLFKICLTNLLYTYFPPRSPEKTAAIKHRITAIIKAVVNADINGVAIALGKKVWL